MRGERALIQSVADRSGGSSPHARGTPVVRSSHALTARIIPACAGNATLHGMANFYMSDHPRMRGERCVRIDPRSVVVGSSPHARGTRLAEDARGRLARIIPACAGNARPPRPMCASRADHPRMRGERQPKPHQSVRVAGSSPHARGTHSGKAWAWRRPRIIPACAGNASRRGCGWPWATDHPRMRGERVSGNSTTAANLGSSPHARGTRIPTGPRPVPRRIIPACAGNACVTVVTGATVPDHPRMRGERVRDRRDRRHRSGSSPHARGTRRSGRDTWSQSRIIPACAGNASLTAV